MKSPHTSYLAAGLVLLLLLVAIAFKPFTIINAGERYTHQNSNYLKPYH